MVADRLYGEFYDSYSVSPEYFGLTLVMKGNVVKANRGVLRG
jgi:hypothetical protein